MFALIALILFILAGFGLATSINLIAFGLAALALHILLGSWLLGRNPPWRS